MNAAQNVVEALYRSEKRYNLFKVSLILGSTIAIFAFTTYEANRSINQVNQKNARVENLLRCSLPAFTPQNYQQASKILNKCLEEK